MDASTPTHPHHLYPSLFPHPTTSLLLHPTTSSPLTPLYHAAARAAHQWSAHLDAWAAATRYAHARPPPGPVPACAEEIMHPNYYFPWLFDEPTAFFPVCVESGSLLAGL
ncbi:hypothetical protein MMC32_006495, partial [Xylographa parallela]|nr:hypothetical protein [Xylographa parallela]